MTDIRFEALGNGHVRLTWRGLYGMRMHATFDPCPVRGLTARESAEAWARDVLGWQP